MSIKYKPVKMCQPGVKGGGNYKFYPRIHKREIIDLRKLSEFVSLQSTVSYADVSATLVSLIEFIPMFLLDNKSIDLGDLGILSINLRSVASDTGEEVNNSKIKGLKVSYRPSNILKKRLEDAEFTKT